MSNVGLRRFTLVVYVLAVVVLAIYFVDTIVDGIIMVLGVSVIYACGETREHFRN